MCKCGKRASIQSQVKVKASAIFDLSSPRSNLSKLAADWPPFASTREGGKNSSGKLIIVAKGIVELVVGKPGCQE